MDFEPKWRSLIKYSIKGKAYRAGTALCTYINEEHRAVPVILELYFEFFETAIM